MSFKLTDFITVSNTGITTFGSDGILINRTGADAYLFFQKSGTNRGAIYGGDASDGNGLRFFIGNNSDPSLSIVSNGQVGIGTPSPGGVFDVSYDAAALNAPRLTDTRSFAINNGAGLDFMGKVNSIGQTTRFGSIYGKKENATDGNTDGYLEFQTNNVARLTISSTGAATFSGNVEIDTNGGDGALGGTLKLSSTNTNVSARNWALINTWDNYGDLTFRVGNAQGDNPLTSGSTKMVITSGGNVGIGTTSPGASKLTISDGVDGYSTANVLLQVKRNATNSNDDTSRSAIMLANNSNAFTIAYGGTTDRLRFINGSGNEQLTLLNGGNLGIGTTTPEELLDIKATSSPAIQLNQADTYKSIVRLAGNDLEIRGSSGAMEFYNGTADGDSSALRMSISSGGNATLNGYLQLGTSASQTILGDFGETNTYLINYNSGGTLKFLVGGGATSNEKLIISSAGAIGQSVTPISDPYVAGAEQWMTYQIGKNGIMGAYKNNDESMFGINTYVDAAGVSKAITSGTNGTAVRFFADSITFNHLTSTGTAQTQTQLLTISSGGVVKINTTGSGTNKLQVGGGMTVWYDSNFVRSASVIYDGLYINGHNGYLWQGTAHDWIIGTNGTERMRISSGGAATFFGGFTYNENSSQAGFICKYTGATPLDVSISTYNNTFNIYNETNNVSILNYNQTTNAIAAPTGNLFCSNGNIIGGSASDLTGTHYFNKGASVNGGILYAGSSTTGRFSLVVQASDTAYNNSPATCLKVGGTSSTSRSISAAGTVNASGADYAEYMTKAVTDTIGKGDIVGVNSDGLLTTAFDDSISFVIKSTNPSLVGNDTWGIESEDEDDIEEARIKVDRIAFSGQVPCNVTGASVGDYIIPVASSDGKIIGEAISNPTFDQYKLSVGKVWKIMEDGRSWVAVKIG